MNKETARASAQHQKERGGWRRSQPVRSVAHFLLYPPLFLSLIIAIIMIPPRNETCSALYSMYAPPVALLRNAADANALSKRTYRCIINACFVLFEYAVLCGDRAGLLSSLSCSGRHVTCKDCAKVARFLRNVAKCRASRAYSSDAGELINLKRRRQPRRW